MKPDNNDPGTALPIGKEELARIREEAMEFSTVGIYRYRMDGTLVFIDRGVLRLLDIDDSRVRPEDLFGRNISELLYYVEQPSSLRSLTLEKGVVRNLEYRYRTLSGEDRWVYHCAYMVKNELTGEPEFQVLARDITELKKTAIALEASEKRLKNLIEHSPMGIMVSSSDPHRILLMNPAMLTLLAPDGDSLLNGSLDRFLDRFHPEDRKAASDVIINCKPESAVPLRLSGTGNQPVFVEIATSEIDFDGFQAIQVVLNNVTSRVEAERRRLELEEQVHRSQRMESLGVLAGGVAHDFNNLLAAIMGNTDLLKHEFTPGTETRETLEEIMRAAGQGADLCRQLLDYSGRKPMNKSPVDLNRVVEETTRLLGITIPRRINLTLELEGKLPAVHGDASQLRQVLMNLVTNAAEAVGDSPGQIHIRTGCSPCDTPPKSRDPGERSFDPTVFLEVEDNGCGMPPHVLNRIFEPFFSTKFTGRGLGLAAVRGIVQGHGGVFDVKSQEGHGTCFRVLVPASDQKAPDEQDGDGPEQHLTQGGTILLADDDEGPRKVLGKLLASLGFTCVEAREGAEAVRLFSENPRRFTCAVLDVMMPVMDGLDCLRELRRMRPGFPALFVSGYNAEVINSDLIDANTAFLQKPFRLNDLRASLSRLFKNGELTFPP